MNADGLYLLKVFEKPRRGDMFVAMRADTTAPELVEGGSERNQFLKRRYYNEQTDKDFGCDGPDIADGRECHVTDPRYELRRRTGCLAAARLRPDRAGRVQEEVRQVNG